MSQAQQTIRVLLIQPDGETPHAAAGFFGPSVDLVRAATVGEASSLLADNNFDYVIASTNNPTFESLLAGTAPVDELDAGCEGVGVFDSSGQLVWANPAFLSFAEDIRAGVEKACVETFTWTARRGGGSKAGGSVERRSSLQASGGGEFHLTMTPIIDMDHQVTQVVAVVRDVTRARARSKQLDAINHAGRELVRMDAEQVSQLNTEERLALLEEKIVRYLHDLMHFDNFSIHVLDRKTNKLEPVLMTGMPQALQTLDLFALPEGNGIAGYVAYHGRSYNCPDVAADSRYFRAMDGARSSLTVPLRLNDQVIGILNVENTEPDAFDQDQCTMAEILGRDIAAALHILDLMVTERYTTTGRLGSDVMAGVTTPLNEIMTDIENLVVDYVGHDDLRHRLNRISTNAVTIRESIKDATSPRRGVLGHRSTGVKRSDPTLTGKKLLVIDDEDMIRETVHDVLTSYGCEVSVANNGDRAVELIREQSYDLVLSDIKMPGRNGYEVFAAVKEANAATPVILMTGFGYDPNHSIVRARRDGLAAVLFKPFKVDQLLGELRAALHTSAG